MRATLRASFHCSLDDLGNGLTGGDLIAIINTALLDTSTYLGAEVAKYAYTLSIADRVKIMALAGKEANKALPEELFKKWQRKQEQFVPEHERKAAEKVLRTRSIFQKTGGFDL